MMARIPVADLQQHLAAATGVPAPMPRLLFAGQLLADAQPLSAYRGLSDGACVICQTLPGAPAPREDRDEDEDLYS